MAHYCPACGFNLNKQFVPVRDMQALFGQRNESCKAAIREVAELITKNIPTDKAIIKKAKFLRKITKADDATVKRGIESYIRGGHHLQGKGYDYLAVVINNTGQNSERQRYNEKKRLGTVPPKRKIK